MISRCATRLTLNLSTAHRSPGVSLTNSRDFELRRITTNYKNVRTDFFEFYWAHLMNETKMAQVWAWARVLLIRNPSRIPKQLKPVWRLLVAPSLLFLAGASFRVFPEQAAEWIGLSKSQVDVATGAVALAWVGIAWFLVHYVGDAARYLHVRPPNIDVRHSIRTAGVDLLTKLHESGKYNRIVIVGHSLGSVIGYDILTYFWQSCYSKLEPEGTQLVAALEALECLADQRKLQADVYLRDQAAYFRELRDQQCPWLVTDFITLGSPLANAGVLLAKNMDRLKAKQCERELPRCPPQLEDDKRFSFTSEDSNVRKPYHAALFAPTRWTNLYFPSSWAILGDPIGGPLAPAFGPGVRDVPVKTQQQGYVFTHTLYWKEPSGATAPHIQALREALRIVG
jgi:hypothetical protein